MDSHESSNGAACAHHFIERWAGETPNALALVYEDRQLTYRQLNESVRRFARQLIDAGVTPQALVGISMNRSLEMLIALLGTLTAGAGYVPLDPAYPQERIAYMIADSKLALILTQKEFDNKFSRFAVPVLHVEEDATSRPPSDERRADVSPGPDDPAYAIHTSGSTGKPKGVLVPHRSLRNFVEIATDALGGNSGDTYLLSASLNYALSVRQIFVPLCQGATLVIANEPQVANPISFLKLLKQQKITRIDLVPSYWRALIESLEDLPHEQQRELLDNDLRQIVSIGEQLSSDLPDKWANVFRHPARLINIYGQTETTGIVSAFPIPKNFAGKSAIVPIGRPISRTAIIIMDEELAPVAPGEEGEICISNPCLALGYLHNAELTSRKFVILPGSNERIYRTGDLGRLLPDGAIEHLGRLDHQIKIRGKRVELGEIESVMRGHPEIKNCAVIPNVDKSGDQLLTAFLVPAYGADPAYRTLRSYLESKLPDYMVPQTLVELDRLPTMPNGKIDRLYLAKLLDRKGSPTGRIRLKKEEPRDWFYVPVWRPGDLEPGRDPDAKASTWMLFTDDGEPGRAIGGELEERGHTVIRITQGESFRRMEELHYALDPANSDDFTKLVRDLEGRAAFPGCALYLWGQSEPNAAGPGADASDNRRYAAYHGFVFLVKALGAKTGAPKIRLGVITRSAQKVTENDLLHPQQALLTGACSVIPLEYKNISCVCIDMEDGWDGKNAVSNLLHAESNSFIAYRNNERFVRTFQPLHEEETSGRIRIRRNGVYLVTGGLGGIGLELGEYLAGSFNAKVILLGRSSFPDEPEWDSWLQEHDGGDEISRKIRKLRAAGKQGGSVSIYRADVTDPGRMREVIGKILDEFGIIHGVFHAAGVRGAFTPIQQAAIEESRNVLDPKVAGTLVLSESLEDVRPDFMVLFSSLSSILGRLGQVDYCAGNAFLDAFAGCQTRGDVFTLSINWDVWRDVEMAAGAKAAPELQALRDEDLEFGIRPREGLAALSRLLKGTHTQVAVSTRNLHQRIFYPGLKLRTLVSDSDGVPYVSPVSTSEKSLAAIWQEVLGVERVGLHDNFFGLGGHSISAVRVISRVRREFDVEMPIRAVFDSPTLQEAAREIEKLRLQGGGKQPGRIRRISREKRAFDDE